MPTSKIIYYLNTDNDFIENPVKNIKQKKYETTEQSYLILNSDINDTLEKEEDIYHSVILDYPSKRLLSFAPPIHTSDFTSFVGNNIDEIYINY